jgi:hypothetical protein
MTQHDGDVRFVPKADVSDPRFASDEAASEERPLNELSEMVHSANDRPLYYDCFTTFICMEPHIK